MKNIETLGEVVKSDVLIVGGGISGLLAAVNAKKEGADVLVVDKGGIGWAGQVPISGGLCMMVRPEDAEKYFTWLVDVGEYLNNQDWTEKVARESFSFVGEASDLGLPFLRDGEKLAIFPYQKGYDIGHFDPGKFMVKLKQAAVSIGIRILDKVYVIELLNSNGKVSGALGFGLVNGKLYIFEAKSVVIANGSCRYQQQRHFVVNTGEGVAMAYRAGAQLLNAEFCNNYSFGFRGGIRKRTRVYLFFENALGERFIGKYYPELLKGLQSGQEFQDHFRIMDAMAKEVKAGNGPIYIDFSKLSPEEREIALSEENIPGKVQPVGRGNMLKLIREKTGIDPDKEKLEVIPHFNGGQGPIRIDLKCRTTIEGLWAVGDAGSLGSGYTGARAAGTFPGFGIAYGIISGLIGGRNAGKYAIENDRCFASYSKVNETQKRIFAPLGPNRDLDVRDIICEIHEAVVPVEYNLYREQGRLNEALEKVNIAKKKLCRASATDSHELCLYHQAESMALCAEWTFKSALLREESRGTHKRLDYPNRDDASWLKWIVIEKEAEGDKIFTEPVPIKGYRLKP